MPRPRRVEIFDSREICAVHCVQRCVRRSYLAGVDLASGKNYEYRREWIRARIEKLASVFGVDVLAYAVLSNHLHVVLRTRPDVVAAWSDKQVALRWLQIFPGKRIDEQLGDPTSTDVEALAKDSERILLVRSRLSDISWFMKALSEPIARMANRQDEVTGHFWEGRFKAQRLLDEAAILACCMYVDLNPVRAKMAETPETSKFTSAFDRIEAAKGKTMDSAAAPMLTISREEVAAIRRESTPEELAKRRKDAKKRRGPRVARDAFLAPLTLHSGMNGPVPNKSGVRASDKGFLSFSLEDYVKLLFFTGRKGQQDKRGKIETEHIPILERLGINEGMWCDLVWNFKKYFGRSRGAGSPDRMREEAAIQSVGFFHGQKKARKCYA